MKIFPVIVFTALAAVLPARAGLQIGGRSYPFHFDDSTLTAAERAAIEADVTAFWGSRTNAVFEPGIDGLVRGRIFDDAVHAAPYAAGRIDVPAWVVLSEGTNWSLRIPSDFSVAFRAGVAIRAAHTNEWAELAAFLDGLRPERLAAATDAEVGSFVFRDPGAPAVTAAKAAELRADLGSFEYFAPSVLGLAETNGVSESPGIGLVALVPASSRGSNPQDYVVFRVGWDGSKWMILSLF